MFWYRYNYLAGLSGSILGSCQAAKRCNKNWKEMWCCSALVTLVSFSCPAWLRHDTSRSCPALLCGAEHFFLSGSCLANVWLWERYSGQSQAGFRLWSVQKFRTGCTISGIFQIVFIYIFIFFTFLFQGQQLMLHLLDYSWLPIIVI